MKTIHVKAKGFDDPILINEEDFDESVHSRLSEKQEAKLETPAEKAADTKASGKK